MCVYVGGGRAMALVHTLGKPKRKSRYQSPWDFWSAVILVYIDIQGYTGVLIAMDHLDIVFI